jgi:hypothetical protein
VLQEYALEGKKNRKLTEKTAGQLAKVLRKNAKKQEAKKAIPPSAPAGTPKPAQAANLANNG